MEGIQALMVRKAFLVCLMSVVGAGLIHPPGVGAQDVARLQSGVVKITAKPPQGTANVGTGFIVRLETNAAYIVTVAHVVAGDAHPQVEFFPKRNMPVTAEVLGLEGDDEVRGLALVVVRGSENLPKGLTELSLAGGARLLGGEDILVIGFPRNAGPWALIKGNISSRQGRDIFFSPSVESGHSGGPIFQGGKVVGIVGAGNQSVGRGVTARSVQDYIEGFEQLEEVKKQEAATQGIRTQTDKDTASPLIIESVIDPLTNVRQENQPCPPKAAKFAKLKVSNAGQTRIPNVGLVVIGANGQDGRYRLAISSIYTIFECPNPPPPQLSADLNPGDDEYFDAVIECNGKDKCLNGTLAIPFITNGQRAWVTPVQQNLARLDELTVRVSGDVGGAATKTFHVSRNTDGIIVLKEKSDQ